MPRKRASKIHHIEFVANLPLYLHVFSPRRKARGELIVGRQDRFAFEIDPNGHGVILPESHDLSRLRLIPMNNPASCHGHFRGAAFGRRNASVSCMVRR